MVCHFPDCRGHLIVRREAFGLGRLSIGRFESFHDLGGIEVCANVAVRFPGETSAIMRCAPGSTASAFGLRARVELGELLAKSLDAKQLPCILRNADKPLID